MDTDDMSDVLSDVAAEEVSPKEFLENMLRILSEGGYDVARIYIDVNAGSKERDELFRILSMCQECNLTPDFAAEVFKNINKEDLGLW